MTSMRAGLRLGAPLLLLGLGLLAQTVDLRILQTADVHAAVDHSRRDPESGGWLRIATLINRLRKEAGPERTLVIDCGDTCQGTLLGASTQGGIGPAMLNAVGYDFWIPGNHEFDFGLKRYVELCDAFTGILLCGNVHISLTGTPRSWTSWRMVTKGGARVAIIGANASYLRHWYPEHATRFQVDLVADQLRLAMPAILRARPDAIVLAIHQGWMEEDRRQVNEIPALVRLFPELDLILGGHTHRPRPGRRLGMKTWYAQPPPHGEALVQVDLKIDVGRHRVLSVESQLVKPTADTPQDARVAKAVAPMLDHARKTAGREVGTVTAEISATGTPGIDCGTGELLCRVFAEAAKCPVVIHGKLSDLSLGKGPVTEAHLFGLIPYENDIYTARLTPAELELVVAEQWHNRKSYVFCGLYGVTARVGEAGAKLGPVPTAFIGKDGRLLVAFNSYTAAGGGGRFPELTRILEQPASKKRNTRLAARDALRTFLQHHPQLKITPKKWLQRGG